MDTQDSRDSSEEPADQLPSQTPALGFAAVPGPAAGADFTVPTAAGAKLQTVLLRSLQHRFATQQALETPAGFGGSGLQSQRAVGVGDRAPQEHQSPAVSQEGEEDDGDGFQIFSQLTYEPTFLSQRPPGLGGGPEDANPPARSTSPHETQTQLLAPNSQLDLQPPPQAVGGAATLAAPAEEEEEWPSSQLLTQQEEPPPPQQQQHDDAARRASGASTAGQKTTPALASSEAGQHEGAGPSGALVGSTVCGPGLAPRSGPFRMTRATPAPPPLHAGQKMFPLFRPRSSHKKLYIVRHGESLYNAAVHAHGSSWADPLIFDAALTDRGRQQALALRGKLAALKLPPDTLWVASPLQRALQTLLLACPAAHLLGKGGCGGAENSAANRADGHLHSPPNVVVLPSISEMVGRRALPARATHHVLTAALVVCVASVPPLRCCSSLPFLSCRCSCRRAATWATRPASCAGGSRSWTLSWPWCRSSGGTARPPSQTAP